jgi:hypothetical protein
MCVSIEHISMVRVCGFLCMMSADIVAVDEECVADDQGFLVYPISPEQGVTFIELHVLFELDETFQTWGFIDHVLDSPIVVSLDDDKVCVFVFLSSCGLYLIQNPIAGCVLLEEP